MSVKSQLKLEGVVTIRLIDKKSGKTVYEKRVKNAIMGGLALAVCAGLAGDPNFPFPKITSVSLRDENDNVIKFLMEESMTVREWRSYSDHYDVHVVFKDTSSDAYTVVNVNLGGQGNTTSYSLARQTNLNVAKAADQVLVVDWVINVPFQA